MPRKEHMTEEGWAIHKAYLNDYMNKRYHRIRSEWIESKGGKCASCGSIDKLEIDHIDRSTKSFVIGKILNHAKEKREKELAKCQVLCHDCHEAKTVEENSFTTHGNAWTYYHKRCRCEVCCAWVLVYNAKRREERSKHSGLAIVANARSC